MEWFLEDAAGNEYAFEPDDYSLDRYYDEGTIRASVASLDISRKVPAYDKQWIRMVDGGKTRFLGYISRKPTIQSTVRKSIQALGVESLLFSCPCPVISIPYNSVDMQDIFSDAAYPGLIYAANSHIPPGWLEDSRPAETTDDWIAHGPCTLVDATNGIAKLENCGSRSRLGTKTIYVNGTAYTDRASYALMAANDRSTYRDTDDLWIRYYYSGALEHGYRFLPMYALNAFDTRCRMGTVESTYTFTTPINLGPEYLIGDILAGIATAHSLNLRPRYEGQLCYIDALEDFDDDGIFDIHEEECDEIRFEEPSYSPASSVTGLGACPRLFQQMQSILYTNPGGAFIRSQTELPEAYYDSGGNICPLTTAQWSATRPKHIMSIDTARHPYIPLGSSVRPLILGYAPTVYQLRAIKLAMGKAATLELGARSFDILDARDALSDVGNAYAFEILPEISSFPTRSGVLTVGATNKSEVSFTSVATLFPTWESVADYNPRVLVDVSLNATSSGFLRPYDSVAKFKMSVNTSTSFSNANVVQESASQHYIVAKDVITSLDVTSKITWNANNYFNVSIVLLGALPNAGDDTNFAISLNIYIVGRRELTG